MDLHNGFRQRQPQPDARRILRKAAAVESLEQMGQVLRVDAGAGVHHPDAHKVGKAAALYRHGVPGAGVVQRILDQVAHGLAHPHPVTAQAHPLLCRDGQLLLLLPGAAGKGPGSLLQQTLQILFRFFQLYSPRIQPGELEQTLHQLFHPVQLLFGKFGQLPHIFCVIRSGLQKTVVDIQSGQRRLELVRDIGHGVLQKLLFPLFPVGMGVEHCRHLIHFMEQPVQLPFTAAVQPGSGVPVQQGTHLRSRFLQPFLPSGKISSGTAQHPGRQKDKQPQQRQAQCRAQCPRRAFCRQQGRSQPGAQPGKQLPDIVLHQKFHLTHPRSSGSPCPAP